MSDGADKWRVMESEMDRFEAEISSLVKPAFIPASVRRAVIPTPPKLTPVIISGAPQVYKPVANSRFPTSTTTVVRPTIVPRHVRPPLIPGAPQITTGTGASTFSTLPKPFAPSMPTSTSLPVAAGPAEASKPINLPGVGKLTSTSIVDDSQAGPSSSAGSGDPNDNAKPSTSSGGADGSPSKTAKKKSKKKVPDGEKKQRKHIRSAGGTVWEDPTLLDWDTSDFRLFCGDLGNDVTDEVLTRVFGRYASFQKAKVVRDKRTNKTRGYGFVSFKDPNDFVKAIRELDGRYVGSRPIKLRKSNWKNRTLGQVRKREKEQRQFLGIKKPK